MYKSTISSRADISVSLLKIGYYFISYLLFVFISNMNTAHVAHFITATVSTHFIFEHNVHLLSFDFPISHDIYLIANAVAIAMVDVGCWPLNCNSCKS